MSFFDREAVANALFTLLAPASGAPWMDSGREWKTWSDAKDHPALFLRDGDEIWLPREIRDLRPRVVLEFEAWLYASGPIIGTPPATALNGLVQYVDTALIPPPGLPRVTLGDLVQHCWIEGTAVKDTGEYSGQPTAMIPIRVLVI
jgi:hypothetical protein